MNHTNEQVILTSICKILADLYPKEIDARRVASQANLNVQQIPLNDSAANMWFSILEEARKSEQIPNVLHIARDEYPTNIALQTIETNWRQEKSGTSLSNHSVEPKTVPLEQPYGTVSPTSRFYIERQADRQCRLYFGQNSAVTIFVQGPSQVGKSSLMHHMLYQAKEQHNVAVVYVTFQRFEKAQFDDLDDFLLEFCGQIGDYLGIPDAISAYWSSPRRSTLVKCSNYIKEHIISTIDRPLVLAIDEVEKLFEASFRNDFFGMLRTWHNDRSHDPAFQKLSLFLSSSTEPHLYIDNPNQSPFNVAVPLTLDDFTLEEVHELNIRHANLLQDEEIALVHGLLNGHPFLTRLAFYTIAVHQISVTTLIDSAAKDDGPFYAHLVRLWDKIAETRELRRALEQICRGQNYPRNSVYRRLKEAGIVRRNNNEVEMRNKLYERFFAERFGLTG